MTESNWESRFRRARLSVGQMTEQDLASMGITNRAQKLFLEETQWAMDCITNLGMQRTARQGNTETYDGISSQPKVGSMSEDFREIRKEEAPLLRSNS